MSNAIYPAIQMTDSCNKNCSACLRTPGVNPTKQSYKSIQNYVSDLKILSERYSILYQFVTGGEPTIWKEDGKDIIDVLTDIKKSSVVKNLIMPSNGKNFENYDIAKDFLKRLSDSLSGPMIIGVSIAEYQNNLTDDGYIALDNLFKICKDPDIAITPIILVTLSVEDDIGIKLKKIYPDAFQRVTPMAPLGSAAKMLKNCPTLSLHGNDKSTVGSFLPHYKIDAQTKLKITEDEFDEMPNAELMDKMSLFGNCGKSPFIASKWHYCLPFKGNPDYDLCATGEMNADLIDNLIDRKPLLQNIRNKGIISTIKKYKNSLSQESKQRIDFLFSPDKRVSIAYRGCMLCKELYETGVFAEIDELNS